MAGSAEEPENVIIAGSTEEHGNVSWLINIVMEDHPETRQEPPIQKVHPTLRQVKTNETYFVPKVVSLGPYHHGNGCNAKPMDYLKEDAVRWFISLLKRPNSNDEVREILKEFVKEASPNEPLKHWYAANDETIKQLEEEDFTVMMFVDGCFILYVVDKWLHDDDDVRYTDHIHQPFILSDMFLLENQIPYIVLKSLLSLMPDPKALNEKDIEKFIEQFILEHAFLDRRMFTFKIWDLVCVIWHLLCGTWDLPQSTYVRVDKESLHLLDFLTIKLIGDVIISNADPKPIPNDRYYVRSIMELKAKGIKIRKSNSNKLSAIEFKEGFIHGHLSLPQMIINDRTRTQLLNLIAYEMCPGFTYDRVITSYVCFLDCLIDHADDVKKLRSLGILRNRLGSDEEVAKLFNEVATNSIPDPRVYGDTLKKIQDHYNKKFKVWVAEMLHIHFRSPWTVISLMAAIFFLFLSVVQTIFTVW